MQNAEKSYDEELYSFNAHFGNSLPLIKSLLQRKHTSLQLPQRRELSRLQDYVIGFQLHAIVVCSIVGGSEVPQNLCYLL